MAATKSPATKKKACHPERSRSSGGAKDLCNLTVAGRFFPVAIYFSFSTSLVRIRIPPLPLAKH
ncbi:MAG: hypothetical protein WBW36_21740, partial [Candidatus Sulfotelmatobacter sp.]